MTSLQYRQDAVGLTPLYKLQKERVSHLRQLRLPLHRGECTQERCPLLRPRSAPTDPPPEAVQTSMCAVRERVPGLGQGPGQPKFSVVWGSDTRSGFRLRMIVTRWCVSRMVRSDVERPTAVQTGHKRYLYV